MQQLPHILSWKTAIIIMENRNNNNDAIIRPNLNRTLPNKTSCHQIQLFPAQLNQTKQTTNKQKHHHFTTATTLLHHHYIISSSPLHKQRRDTTLHNENNTSYATTSALDMCSSPCPWGKKIRYNTTQQTDKQTTYNETNK